MTVLPVRFYGDPVLRAKARPVESVDDDLRRLAADMRETMRAFKGVGLAANQVGDLRRVLVMEAPLGEDRREAYTLVNPRLHDHAGAELGEEGCLSIPGVWEEVKRAARVRVTALSETGEPLDFMAEGYVARILQHEVDHLDGVLFVDRLSRLKRQFLKKQLDAIARGELPEDAARPELAP